MKKLAMILTTVMLLAVSGIPAFADMGAPENPEFTVTIGIYGTDYYSDYDDYENGRVGGKIPGGSKFYVWESLDSGAYYGTVNGKASYNSDGSFVFIKSSDIISGSERIPPEVGEKTENTVSAETTDDLNLRCGPGVGFKSLKVLDKGTKVEYDYTFETDTTWMYVDTGSLEGWVCGDYLKTTGISDTTTTQEETTDKEDVTENGSDQSEAGQNEAEATTEPAKAGEISKTFVAGIILVCVGAAILIAALAFYLLNNRRK